MDLGGEISHLTRVGDRLIASVQHVSGVGQLASLDWRTGDVSTWHWFDPAVDQVVVRGGELWALEPRPGRLLRLDSKTLDARLGNSTLFRTRAGIGRRRWVRVGDRVR